MLLTPEIVYRRYNTIGVPDSGPHNVDKDEAAQLISQLFGVSRGGWVVARTLSELNAVTTVEATDGGVVLTGAGAGYYDRDGSAWVFGRSFPDTFAKVALAGSGTVQTGTVGAGVNPSSIEVFFAKVITPNTGPMTLAINGGTAQPVRNLAGNALSAGEWTGMVMFYLNDANQYQLLLDAGAAASAAASATAAGVAFTNFDIRYLGAKAADPTTNNAGGVLITGALYFNTTDGKFRVWTGVLWQDQSTSLSDGGVTEPKHATGGVSTRALADAGVTEPKLAGALALTLTKACYSIAELQAVNTARYHVANLALTGRDGMFTWVADASAALLGAAIASSSVNATTETITSAAHGLVTGQAVVATTAVNGLALNTLYYVVRVDANNFRLATSFANAKAGTLFNLTGTTATTVKRHSDPLMGIYVTPAADLSGATGAWVRQHSSPYNVKWFGAKGTGSDDDTQPIQAAIFFAEGASLRQVFIPAHNISAFYLTTSELSITKPVEIIGEHSLVTIAQVGMSTGQSMFQVDGSIFPNYEHFTLKALTVRPYLSSGDHARGITLNRVAHVVMEDVIILNASHGVIMTGDRGFANSFKGVQISSSTIEGLRIDGFTGGGQHTFETCSFNGNAVGLHITSSSLISALHFQNCAWEGNGQAFLAEGNVSGIGFYTCYSEKNTPVGGYTLGFIPAVGKTQRAIVISGGFWETDSESYPFLFGGSGTVLAFEVSGVETEGYGVALVRGNGVVGGGQIRSNYLQNMTAVVSNGPLIDVTIANNRNASGSVTA